mmetsp:Transcript_6306/g.22768  ORF Transcript_6306/g.22768 Transcript_6306/m.22768 type:complete len:82 (-) Transcript_6306:18-263(-)
MPRTRSGPLGHRWRPRVGAFGECFDGCASVDFVEVPQRMHSRARERAVATTTIAAVALISRVSPFARGSANAKVHAPSGAA